MLNLILISQKIRVLKLALIPQNTELKVLLEMKDIVKEFPGGVRALDRVNIKVEEGSIHALVGENGAGKSTLMNVLSGIYPYGSYEGEICYDGEECRFNTIRDSEKRGIVIIHQELALIPYLSVMENIFLGNEKQSHGIINWGNLPRRGDETHAAGRAG